MELEVRPLTADRISDFYSLHCEANEGGWCRCVAWAVPTWEGWGERTAEENRALRDELFARGELDLRLLYDGEQPIASCQVGPRDRFPKLLAQLGLDPDPDCWAITCFFVAPAWRRKGAARRLLEAVIAELRERGVPHLQAFPKRGADLDAGELWTGPEALYREAGFQVVRDDPLRPVLELSP